MRVGIVSMEYPPETAFGGIATYSQTLSRALVRLGHEVHVVSLTLGPSSRIEEDRGVRVHRLRVPRFPLPLLPRFLPGTCRDLRFSWVAARHVRRLHREEPFDVIECPEWGAASLFLSLARPAPIVVRLHAHLAMVLEENGEPRTLDARIRCRLEEIACRLAGRLVSNSAGLRERVAADYRLRTASISVLPCPLEPEAFAEARDAASSRAAPGEATSVVYAGRIEERKGVRLLLEAMREVWTDRPDATLVLAGRDTPSARLGGSLRMHLEAQARALGRSGSVSFLGEMPRAALRGVFREADLVVAPAPFEALGYTTLEAMAAGKPVVGSASGGTREIVQDGETGLLFTPGDSRALGRAITRLLSDGDLRGRLGRRAREEAHRFAAAAIAKRMVSEYREAIRRRGGPRAPAAAARRPRERFVDLFPAVRGEARERLREWLGYLFPRIASHPWQHYFIAEARQVLDLFDVCDAAADRPLRILEPGSGHGVVGALLASLGAHVWLLDSDPEALGEARAHAEALGVSTRVHTVQADLFHMPFPDGVFDLVWNDGVLEHFDAPEDALCEMVRVARPGGAVLVLVPQRRTIHTVWVRRRQRRRNAFPFDAWGRERSYSPRQLERLFARAGLTNVRARSGNLRRAILDDWIVLPRLRRVLSPENTAALFHLFDRLESSIEVLAEMGFAAAAIGRRPAAPIQRAEVA
jgi:glycogen(starch) synthase